MATPRTDSETASTAMVGGKPVTVHGSVVWAEFARTLERELASSAARVAELEKALAEASIEMHAFETQLMNSLHTYSTAHGDIIAACEKLSLRVDKEIPALRADKERLDWLEANPLRIGWSCDTHTGLHFFIRADLPKHDVIEGFNNFRSVIDAARSDAKGANQS